MALFNLATIELPPYFYEKAVLSFSRLGLAAASEAGNANVVADTNELWLRGQKCRKIPKVRWEEHAQKQ